MTECPPPRPPEPRPPYLPRPAASGSLMPDALATEPRPIRSRTFAALSENPAYRRFYAGQGVSLIGSWLQEAAVSWIVFDMTRSESWLGIVSAAGVLPGLVVGLAAGAL